MGVDIVEREYIWMREEESQAQTTLIALTSVAVVVLVGVINLLRSSVSWLGASPEVSTPNSVVYLFIPIVPLALTGWITHYSVQAGVRRNYLFLVEQYLARDSNLVIGFRPLVADPNDDDEESEHDKSERLAVGPRGTLQAEVPLPFGARSTLRIGRKTKKKASWRSLDHRASYEALFALVVGATVLVGLNVVVTTFSMAAAWQTGPREAWMAVAIALFSLIYAVFIGVSSIGLVGLGRSTKVHLVRLVQGESRDLRRPGPDPMDSGGDLSAEHDGEGASEIARLPLRASLYMDTRDRRSALRLVGGVENLFDAFDVEIERAGPLRSGSLRQLFGIGNPKEVTDKIVDGVAAALAGVPQAEMNLKRAQAVALLAEQARDPAIPNMVLECEDFVLVKVTPTGDSASPVIVIKQLNSRQKDLFARNASWALMPERMLQLLSVQESDGEASVLLALPAGPAVDLPSKNARPIKGAARARKAASGKTTGST